MCEGRVCGLVGEYVVVYVKRVRGCVELGDCVAMARSDMGGWLRLVGSFKL